MPGPRTPCPLGSQLFDLEEGITCSTMGDATVKTPRVQVTDRRASHRKEQLVLVLPCARQLPTPTLVSSELPRGALGPAGARPRAHRLWH